ncbi:MAG: hypothetical protein NC084_08855 [Bacteroides sp.]|nr:hypothetical protein [Eubacterium sp.]MCM1418737.1 hypothetical protein [Roseburia sp.]MCM1462805.1 hypothetical protein [Bacteroides sp.]
MFCQKCGRETGAPIVSCPSCGEALKPTRRTESAEDTLLKIFGILFGVYGRFSLITLLAVLSLEWGDFMAGLGRFIACLPVAVLCQAIVFLGMIVLLKKKWALIPLGLILLLMGAGAVILILFGNHTAIAAANLTFAVGLLIGVFECLKAVGKEAK